MRFLPLILLTCLAATVRAQPNANAYDALSARVLVVDHTYLNDDLSDASQTFALELGYARQLGKFAALAIPFKVGLIDVGDLENHTIYSIDGLLRLYPTGAHRGFAPYLQAGYGITGESGNESYTGIPLGGGFNIRLGAYSWLSLQGEYRVNDRELRDNLMAGIGLTLRLGGTDSDGDGLPDRTDTCPDAPGPPETQGCPDSDGDTVLDKDDRCPETPGLVAQRGCPDTDRDGIIDRLDRCPETPGLVSVNGCPDRDGDGVGDKDDDCPTDPGPAELQGCPDGDGDGLIDKRDDCPGEAGLKRFRGCPDRDGDGLPDDADRCPDTPGNLVTGCPDEDDDGFNDDVDQCPGLAGPLNGCPDTDGDKIADKDDRCPRRAGPASNNGCPN